MTTHPHAQSVVKQLVLSNHLDMCCLQGNRVRRWCSMLVFLKPIVCWPLAIE